MKIVSYIVTDDAGSKQTAAAIREGLADLMRRICGEDGAEQNWRSYVHDAAADSDAVTAEFDDELSGELPDGEADALEDADCADIAEQLLPKPLLRALNTDDAPFGWLEADDCGDTIKVSLMLRALSHTTAELRAMQAALIAPEAQHWTLRLSESVRKDGVFESTMISPALNDGRALTADEMPMLFRGVREDAVCSDPNVARRLFAKFSAHYQEACGALCDGEEQLCSGIMEIRGSYADLKACYPQVSALCPQAQKSARAVVTYRMWKHAPEVEHIYFWDGGRKVLGSLSSVLDSGKAITDWKVFSARQLHDLRMQPGYGFGQRV